MELAESELWTRWLLPDWPADQVGKQAVRLHQLWREATGRRDPIPEAKEVIVELFRRGYRLGVASNTTSSTEAPQLLKKLGVSGLFETVALSCVVGKRKGDPGLLLEATTRMGLAPEKCVYIGNLPHRDVVAARQAGFSQVILLRNPFNPEQQQVDDPALLPDQIIDNLKDLLEIFPPLSKTKTKTPVEEPAVWSASLSTMWAMKNFPSLKDFFVAARRLGFDRIELNHQVDSTMLAGIDLDHVQFSSVHEPCPADISVDDLKNRDWLISAQDEENRRQGVESVKRSIDLAHTFGAGTIVVHAGNVSSDLTPEKKLRSLFEADLNQSEEYLVLKEKMERDRAALVGRRLAAVRRSLVELLEYAGRYGIRLGLENRYHYMDIPLPDEIGQLLDLAVPERLGFIYDVGHAQALDRLGFCAHNEWLERFAARIIGTHLHDVVGVTDHQAPGLGEIDFDHVAAYLPGDAFRTLELHPSNSPEQVKVGLRYLADRGCVELL
jgi:sugar phosphate isomerase/epimerase/FMN phosphatase YigB (HAD superfamily)